MVFEMSRGCLAPRPPTSNGMIARGDSAAAGAAPAARDLEIPHGHHHSDPAGPRGRGDHCAACVAEAFQRHPLHSEQPGRDCRETMDAALVDALLPLAGTVLVAWEHKAIISDILPRLPVSNADQLPTHWSGKRFDVVLRLDRAAGATEFEFQELYPCLMPGDSTKPLKNDPKDD